MLLLRARLVLGLVLFAGLAGCVSTGRLTPGKDTAPAFDAAVFFAGRTQGRGVLKIATRAREAIAVEGRGLVAADGTIRLEQRVMRGDGPATMRTWLLRTDGPGRLSGTLSDAAGPVSGEVEGNVLHLRFTMEGGVRADQWLTLQPGGERVENVMVIRKFGLPVARLDEVIMRVGE